jgi:hypothetical protein
VTDQKQTAKRGFKRRTIVLALGVAGLTAFGVFRIYVFRQLMKRIEVLQARGYPVSMAEVDVWYLTIGY